MSPLAIAVSILVPTVGIALAFFYSASRRSGLDRRKNVVGGVVMVTCGLVAAAAAGIISTIEPG